MPGLAVPGAVPSLKTDQIPGGMHHELDTLAFKLWGIRLRLAEGTSRRDSVCRDATNEGRYSCEGEGFNTYRAVGVSRIGCRIAAKLDNHRIPIKIKARKEDGADAGRRRTKAR